MVSAFMHSQVRIFDHHDTIYRESQQDVERHMFEVWIPIRMHKQA
jgi:hypothetical protein